MSVRSMTMRDRDNSNWQRAPPSAPGTPASRTSSGHDEGGRPQQQQALASVRTPHATPAVPTVWHPDDIPDATSSALVPKQRSAELAGAATSCGSRNDLPGGSGERLLSMQEMLDMPFDSLWQRVHVELPQGTQEAMTCLANRFRNHTAGALKAAPDERHGHDRMRAPRASTAVTAGAARPQPALSNAGSKLTKPGWVGR